MCAKKCDCISIDGIFLAGYFQLNRNTEIIKASNKTMKIDWIHLLSLSKYTKFGKNILK